MGNELYGLLIKARVRGEAGYDGASTDASNTIEAAAPGVRWRHGGEGGGGRGGYLISFMTP